MAASSSPTDGSPSVNALAVDLVVMAARFTRYASRQSKAGEATAVWRAFAILEEHGPMRVSDFAEIDRCSQPTATTMMQRLEQAGTVQRLPDPNDGRATLLSLSATGRRRLTQLRAGVAVGLGPQLSQLSDAERAELEGAVRTIAKLISSD